MMVLSRRPPIAALPKGVCPYTTIVPLMCRGIKADNPRLVGTHLCREGST